MNSFQKKAVAVFSLFVAATGVQAQDKLSLNQAVQEGLQNSKTLNVAKARLEAAEARVTETGAALLPSLTLNAGYSRVSEVPGLVTNSITATPPDPNADPKSFTVQYVNYAFANAFTGLANKPPLNNYRAQFSVSQPIFTGFRLSSTQEAAEYSQKAAEEELKRDKSDVVLNIKTAYWNLYKATQLRSLADQVIEQVQGHLKDAQNLLEQGLMTKNDVLRVQVQLSSARSQRIDADAAVRVAQVGLNSLLGRPLNSNIVPEETLPGPAPGPREELSTLADLATRERHEVAAANYRIRAGEASVRAVESGWYPQIYLGANYLYANPNQRIFPQRNEWNGTWDAGVNLSWNIWNWNTTGAQAAQAQAQVVQAREGLRQIQDAITVQTTQAYVGVDQARQKIGVAQEMVAQAQENYRITNEKYKAGLALTSDLLDAETALTQARVNFTQSQVDLQIAQARLSNALAQE